MKAGDSMIQATTQSVIAQTRGGTALHRSTRGEQPDRGTKGDRVELSKAALENLQKPDIGVRTDLVQRIRAEIAAGTYLTDEKLDSTVDRLHRDLFR